MAYIPIDVFPEITGAMLNQDSNIIVAGPLKTGRLSIKELALLLNANSASAALIQTTVTNTVATALVNVPSLTVWNNTVASGVSIKGNGYYVDTSVSPITLSLPAAAASVNGDKVVFKDKAGTFALNPLTITSDTTIEGLAQPFVVGVNKTYVALEFVFGNWVIA